jgi:hypothetical protein
MNGATFLSSVHLPAVTDQNWKIVGTSDFDNNSQPDILWRNTATGANAVWYMNGATFLSSQFLLAATDPNWEIVGP